MKKKCLQKKVPGDYPLEAFRPSRELLRRVKSLVKMMKNKLHRNVTKSEIYITCIAAKLPELETKYIKA